MFLIFYGWLDHEIVWAEKQICQANLHTIRVLGVLHIFYHSCIKNSVHSLKNNLSFFVANACWGLTDTIKYCEFRRCICQIYDVSLRNSISYPGEYSSTFKKIIILHITIKNEQYCCDIFFLIVATDRMQIGPFGQPAAKMVRCDRLVDIWRYAVWTLPNITDDLLHFLSFILY